MNKQEIINKVVGLVIEAMEKKNKVPWDKGIINLDGLRNEAISWSTGKGYTGINRLVINFVGNPAGEYATFLNIKKAGGKVKKGEKSLPVVFYTMYNKAEKREAKAGDNKEDIIPVLKMFNVFDVSTQVDWGENGYKSKRAEAPEVEEVETKKDIDELINTFASNTDLKIFHDVYESAYYSPNKHEVHLFKPEYHTSLNRYYGTALHELIHSTSKGLKRPLGSAFGTVRYSAEEVVAECGSMLLCNILGIEGENENSATYVANWAKKLKGNPAWLFEGISKAEKAVAYFMEKSK